MPISGDTDDASVPVVSNGQHVAKDGSPQYRPWLDENVEKHGPVKLVLPSDVVASTLRENVQAKISLQDHERFLRRAERGIQKRVEARLQAIVARLPCEADLATNIRQQVAGDRRQHWTEVVSRMAIKLAGSKVAP